MNVRRIASSAALGLALVAAASPAWSADGDGAEGGIAWAGGNSGLASHLGREFARHQRSGAAVATDSSNSYSWGHDSRILDLPAPRSEQCSDPSPWVAALQPGLDLSLGSVDRID